MLQKTLKIKSNQSIEGLGITIRSRMFISCLPRIEGKGGNKKTFYCYKTNYDESFAKITIPLPTPMRDTNVFTSINIEYEFTDKIYIETIDDVYHDIKSSKMNLNKHTTVQYL